MAPEPVTKIEIPSLEHIASGKVRELYRIDPTTLLLIATDRVSVFDAICANPIPDKGSVLTQLSAHWFSILSSQLPHFSHHLLSLAPPPSLSLSGPESALLRGRSMLCRSLKVFPIEAIVRGYITGSAFDEYTAHGTVNSVAFPPGLRRCQPFPSGPIYTPSTKAPAGEKDENITREQARALVGARHADRIEALALEIYAAAHAYALHRGIVIADTKMEFGLDEVSGDVVLVDEVLTPDCSRFWLAPVRVGEEQQSFDKQPIRDFLAAQGLKGKGGVELPREVVEATTRRYREVFTRLTGRSLDQALEALEK